MIILNRCTFFFTLASWGAWSAETPCSVTCGTGTTTAIRQCDNSNETTNCGDEDTRNTNCSPSACGKYSMRLVTRNCLILGSWDEWSVWTSCTVTCDGGSQNRIRECLGGTVGDGISNGCIGEAEEEMICAADACLSEEPNWSVWSDWGECSATCGNSQRQRERTGCESNSCNDLSIEPCSTEDCPSDPDDLDDSDDSCSCSALQYCIDPIDGETQCRLSASCYIKFILSCSCL